jgi:NADH-quinone oxidoreductase subunit N
MMAVQDIMSLLPMLILAGGVLLTMILIAAKRNHILTLASTLIFLAASFASIFFIKPGQPHGIGDIFLIDHFGLYYQALILATTFVIAVFSYICLESFFPEKRKEEFYLLLMLATLGSAMMVVSTHFISFFVSLETLTISLYTLISYYKQRTKAIEAGLKYLILAAMSSSFLLFGMALIYAVSGEMSFIGLSALLPAMSGVPLIMLLAGIGMMIVGIGFKLAVVPFHIWAPDVYEGASAPATAFIATVSKGSIVALLLRFFMMANLYQYGKIMLAFTIISILSMLIGNLLALVQNNVKRILVAFIAGKGMGTQAATFYVTTYTVTILGAFGMITIIPQSDDEATDIENYKGLFWRRPFLAAFFTVFLLSLAGIPLTAGFIGKYFLLTAGLGKEQWGLAFVLIISSVIGLFYYLRLIISLMQQEIETKRIIRLSDFSIAGGLILGTLALLVVCIGIWPDWLLDLINKLS